MPFLLFIIVLLVSLFIIFRLFVGIFGNWRMTLNRVISAYIAMKQLHPKASNDVIFLKVLEARYPQARGDIFSLMSNMHSAKNDSIQSLKEDFQSGSFKPTLQNLIYVCLVIEKNSEAQKRTYSDLLGEIKDEVIRQGFQKYT